MENAENVLICDTCQVLPSKPISGVDSEDDVFDETTRDYGLQVDENIHEQENIDEQDNFTLDNIEETEDNKNILNRDYDATQEDDLEVENDYKNFKLENEAITIKVEEE